MADVKKYLDPFEVTDAPAVGQPSFDFVGASDEIETTRMPKDNLTHRRECKVETLKALRRKFALDHIGEIPPPGTSLHIVTNARFDFWDWIPTLLKMMAPRHAVEFCGSTWILNRRNAMELLALYDAGSIRSIGFMTGIYFKRRESAVFATLYEGLMARGQKFKACLNHSKWFTMLMDDGTGITVESSANFTENGNIETHVLTNDRGLSDFHRGWCNELLDARD